MKILLSLLFSVSAFAASAPDPNRTAIVSDEPVVKFRFPPAPRDYLWTMIACDEREEHYASEAFDAFLTLTARRELKKEELRFPSSFAVVLPNYIVLSRAFYVSQNELRGFEISVPKACLVEKDGMFSLGSPVIVEKEERRQGITIFILKAKKPNKSPEPTPTAVTPRATEGKSK